MKILVPTSAGDLLDRMTILEVKLLYLTDQDKKKNVRLHLKELRATYRTLPRSRVLRDLYKKLLAHNERQWKMEDTARRHWKKGRLEAMARTARAIHLSNDKRTVLKRAIDEHVGSHLVEEKSYAS